MDEFVTERTVDFSSSFFGHRICRVIEPMEPGAQAKCEVRVGRRLTEAQESAVKAVLLRCHRRDLMHIMDRLAKGEPVVDQASDASLEKGPRRKPRHPK